MSMYRFCGRCSTLWTLKCRFCGRCDTEPCSANFVAGAYFVELEVQILWQVQYFVIPLDSPY